MLRRWVAGFVVVAVVALLAGCSSGGDGENEESDDPLDGDDRASYVAGFETAGRDPETGEVTEEGRCIAEAVVDGVGVEQLEDAVTPREIAEAATTRGVSLAGLGIDLDDEQADAIYAGVRGCGDVAEMFLDSIPGGQLPEAAAECFKNQLDDDLLREIVMTRLVDGDAALTDKPELTSRLMDIGLSCAS